MNKIDFEKDQQEVIQKTDNIQNSSRSSREIKFFTTKNRTAGK